MGRHPFLRHQCAFCVTILASDELTRLDLHMKDEESMTPTQLKSGLMGPQLLAISIWNDDETKSLAKAIGADILLDKCNLAAELIPAIRNCANNRNIELLLKALEAGASN